VLTDTEDDSSTRAFAATSAQVEQVDDVNTTTIHWPLSVEKSPGSS
jgi:hypothetical protein